MGANNEFQKIDLNDYIQTGEGGTALAYTHRNGKSLAKLYNPDFDANTIKNEFWASWTAFELGISTPEPFRLITDGKRFGSEYELIEGKRSFSRIISQEPERLEEISLELARMARELHATKADTSRLKSYKQMITKFYSDEDFVPEDYRNRILKFLDKVPDTETCLHGDLQIGNAITDGKRTLWIDLGGFG
ncbi:MAG: TIGR02172 family protein, partial [Treponema sp.]|uniref:TIGR02172 family protein n=1 Tax=Treponema sp. TaxID=166 RepID=UPI002A91460E